MALYIGATSDLARRALERPTGALAGFTRRYDCKWLVWYERYDRTDEAIAREKQLEAGNRKRKLALIEAMNPNWLDLYESLNK